MAISLGVLTTRLFAVVLTMASQDDAASTRDVVLARFERLHNLIVDYKTTTKYTPQIAAEDIVRKDAKGGVEIVATGTRTTANQFSVLRDRCMYRANDLSWEQEFKHPDAKLTLERTIYARMPDRCERFWGNSNGPATYVGEISDYAPLPGIGEIEVALALRAWDTADLMTEKDIRAMALTQTADGKIRLHGSNRYGWLQEWLLDPALACAALRYRLAKPDGTVTDEYTMEDFRRVDGLMLPFRVRALCGTGIDRDHVWTTQTLAVTAYKLNDPNNKPERYRIDWPEGTRVRDIRTSAGSRAAGAVRGM